MRLPLPVNRALLLLGLTFVWTGVSSGAAHADHRSAMEIQRYCMRPAVLAEFGSPWYEWSAGDGFWPLYTCDRAPAPAVKMNDLCRLAADPRHSQGLALARRINLENDGLTSHVGQAAKARPAVVPVVRSSPSAEEIGSRESFEYAFPMSRCDEYWGRPWCACPLYIDPIYGDEPAETVAESPARAASIDASAYRATLRPVASVAANLLGEFGRQMLVWSAALDQMSSGETAPVLHDAAEPAAEREPVWRAAGP